ncbi:hypothetical protein DFH09DRAFT_1381374 [Mycena vulgaris]|nr:hypothetical protein DFH09DRAFT_1381374 [Mycena vulgaris]
MASSDAGPPYLSGTECQANGRDSDSDACSKIWSVYNAEAEKHDKALMESWMRDMKGVLLFAALFSASLTAFIIESYKTLKPDATDTVIALLTRISGQISDLNNGSVSAFPPGTQSYPTSFSPATTSLLCNALWFLSLFLSLTCALLATLVEQWARGFIQRIERRGPPIARAKIFSYLYHGLQQFDMRTVVDLIPLLLHASLLMFFAGLVAFLIPINLALVAVASTWLAFIVGSYACLTVLPLSRSHCPYWTPLSGMLSRLTQTMETLSSSALHESPDVSMERPMVEKLIQQAAQISEESQVRDVRSLCWTARSITDDHALELFIGGISDAIWSSGGRRHSNDYLISGLLEDPGAGVIPRIQHFLADCKSDVTPNSAVIRRQIVCLKTAWAIAAISDTSTKLSHSISSFDMSLLRSSSPPSCESPGLSELLPTVRSLMLWTIFRSFSDQATRVGALLRSGDKDVQSFRALRSDLKSMSTNLRQLAGYVYAHKSGDLETLARIPLHDCWGQDVLAIITEGQHLWNDIPYHILLLLSHIVTAGLINLPLPSATVKTTCELLFTELVTCNIRLLQQSQSVHYMDIALGYLLSMSHRERHRSPAFIQSVVLYLTNRNSTEALLRVFESYKVDLLWPQIASQMTKFSALDYGDDYVKAVWELSCLEARYSMDRRGEGASYRVHYDFWVLARLGKHSTAYASTTVLIKLNVLSGLYRRHFEHPLVLDQLLRHPLLCRTRAVLEGESGSSFSVNERYDETPNIFLAACMEAHLTALADFLMDCSAPIVPYKAAESLSYISFPSVPPVKDLNPTSQKRFAKSVQDLVRAQMGAEYQKPSNSELIQPLIGMLQRNVLILLSDSSAICTITHALAQAGGEL